MDLDKLTEDLPTMIADSTARFLAGWRECDLREFAARVLEAAAARMAKPNPADDTEFNRGREWAGLVVGMMARDWRKTE